METINTIRELLDETPVLAEISNNLPPYYKIPITEKIKDLHTYLEEIHNKEMDENNFTKSIEEINKEFEKEEVVIIENFFGTEIKTSAFNNIIH